MRSNIARKPITKAQAIGSDIFHMGECEKHIGLRGGVRVISQVWRRNGKTKVWKSRPDNYRVPVKHGLYNYTYVTHFNLLWHVEEDCPVVFQEEEE